MTDDVAQPQTTMKPISLKIAFIIYCTANIFIITKIHQSDESIAMQAAYIILAAITLAVIHLLTVEWLLNLHYPKPKQPKQTDPFNKAEVLKALRERKEHLNRSIKNEKPNPHQERLKRKYAIK